MKQFIIPSYTFTPGASGVGTVDLSGILGFNIKYLAAIINQTRGVVIYATGDPARGYTNLVGTTLTLFFDTSSHNSGDTLQVMYELTDLNPLTNAQLRATAVPISGTVAVSGTVPVSGTVTANTGLTQPLTDAQLRSTPVPVSGTVTANTGLSQPLTDAQLRATAVPVSVGSIALPTGASTLAEQQSQTTLLGTIDTDTGSISTSVSSINTKTPTLVGGRVPVDGSGVTQPISASTLPLPSGASTETTLSNLSAKFSSLGQKTMANSAPVVISSDQSAIPITGSITASNPSVSATGSAVPAQGTMAAGTDGTNLRALKTDASGELQVDVLSSALPSGASTESTLSALNTKVPSGLTVSASRLLIDGAGVTQPISASSLPLPFGAATSSNQTTANSSLSSIDAKLGSLGQKLMAGSAPVVIASDQSAIPITGSITATNPSVSTAGAALPASATLVGGSDGTNLVPIAVDSSGQPQTVVTSCALPPDAATETTALDILAKVTSINLKSTTLVGGRIPITFDGIDQPITATSLPLPTGAATSSNQTTTNVNLVSIDGRLASIDGKTPATSTRVVDNETAGSPVRAIGQEIWNVSFSEVGASVISSQFQAPTIGTGVSYNQGSGALNIVAGTTANAEFFTRSTTTWRGAMRLKFSIVASQRIANNNLAVMLADLIGEGLSVTINSATSITVSQSGHAFTSTSVGQFVHIGRIVGAAGVPGRYAIASVVAGVSYNLTVAGWPASGSCTATIFGHSYVRNLVTGTTATAINVDAQRRGWAAGDTAATINTTASPGTIITCELTGREVFWADQLRATSTTPTVVVRANRLENIPDDNLDLYLFVWSFNGTTNPATSTTWTMSFCAIEKFANMPVYIQGNRANGAMNPLPVTQIGTTTISGTVTVNALPAGTNAIGDVGIQYRASTTGAASATHLISGASTNSTIVKSSAGRLIGWSLANTNAAWRYVKFHNQTTNPTAGSGVVRVAAVPPNGVSNVIISGGIAFSTGIGITTVTGANDADTNPVGANDLVGEIIFA